MTDAFIVSGARTPIGALGGSLAEVPAVELGAISIREALSRAELVGSDVEEVVMGNVVSAGQGQNPARQAAIRAGLPQGVGAFTINKVCGSGLKSVMLAVQSVRLGDAQVVVAGGMESMSRAPYLVSGRMGELKFGNSQMTDALLNDGLWDPFENWGMGNAAEFIADEYEVTRRGLYDGHHKRQQERRDPGDAGG